MPHSSFKPALIVLAVIWPVMIFIGPVLSGNKSMAPLRNWLASDPLLESLRFGFDVPVHSDTPSGLSDLISISLPLQTMAHRAWRTGEFPFWDPRSGFGMPFFAVSSSGFLDPVRAVMFHFFDPLRAVDLSLCIYLLLASLGLWLWVRQLGGSSLAGAAGAAIFSLHYLILTTHLGRETAYAYLQLPWLLWATDRLLHRGERLFFFLSTALFFVHFQSGHLEAAFQSVLLCGLLAVLRMAASGNRFPRPFIFFKRAALPPILAAGMSLFLFVPFLDLLRESTLSAGRESLDAVVGPEWLEELTGRTFRNWMVTWGNLAKLPYHFFSPFLFGDIRPLTPYVTGASVIQGNSYGGAAAFFGFLTAIFFGNRLSRALAAAAGCCYAYAFGIPPFSILHLLPVLHMTSRYHAFVMWAACFAAAAALGIDELFSRKDSPEFSRLAVFLQGLWGGLLAFLVLLRFFSFLPAPASGVLAAGSGFLWIFVRGGPWRRERNEFWVHWPAAAAALLILNYGVFAWRHGMEMDVFIRHRGWVPMLSLSLALASLFLAGRRRRTVWAAWVFLLLMQSEILLSAVQSVRFSDSRIMEEARKTPFAFAASKARSEEKEPFRMVSTSKRMFTSLTNVLWDLDSPDQCSPLLLKRYKEMSDAFSPGQEIWPFVSHKLIPKNSSSYYSFWNVRYVLTEASQKDWSKWLKTNRFIQESEFDGVRLWSNPGVKNRYFLIYRWEYPSDAASLLSLMKGKEFNVDKALIEGLPLSSPTHSKPSKGDYVRVERHTLNTVRLRVRNENRALLASSETYFPGWRVWVDGQEERMVRMNYFFRGVFLNSGEHEVLWRYRPRYWASSLLASGMAFLFFAGTLWLWRHRPYEPGG